MVKIGCPAARVAALRLVHGGWQWHKASKNMAHLPVRHARLLRLCCCGLGLARKPMVAVVGEESRLAPIVGGPPVHHSSIHQSGHSAPSYFWESISQAIL